MTAPLVVTVALVPMRVSLSLVGALPSVLLSVVGVALLGGIRPALLVTGVSFLTMGYLYVALLHSFKIDRLVNLVALITFVVVAAAAGGLVDLLTRQGVQVAAPTSKLPTSPGWPLSCFPPPGVVRHRWFAAEHFRPRRRRDRAALPGRWEIEVAPGQIRLENPEDAAYHVELDRDRVLTLDGTRLRDQHTAPHIITTVSAKPSLNSSEGRTSRSW